MKVLTLLIVVTLCAFVRCDIFQCGEIKYSNCWNPKSYQLGEKCWTCDLKNVTDDASLITLNGEQNDKDEKKAPVNVGIVNFNGGSFTKMPVIAQEHFDSPVTKVRLSKTTTKVINAEFFTNNRNLRLLEFWLNKGLSVEGLAFQNCSSLVSLLFFRNHLGPIPLDAFYGMQQLLSLELWDEELTVIEPVWFRDLQNLKVLNLNDNYFKEIPEKAFDSLPELEQLYLGGNKIESISQRMFQHNDKLQKLNLKDNQIKKIQENSFQHLNQLTQLNLRSNICINETFENESLTEIAESLTSCYPITCIVPNITNGFVIKTEDNSTISPGDSIEELTPVKVRCDSTFLLFHDKANQTENSCLASGWQDKEWPKCQSQYL